MNKKEEEPKATFIEEEISKLQKDIKKHKEDRKRYIRILQEEEEHREKEREKGNSPREEPTEVEEETNLDLEAVEYYIERDRERIGYLLSDGAIDELIESEEKEVKWAEEALRDSTKNIVVTRKKINKREGENNNKKEVTKRKQVREEDTLEYKLAGHKLARDFWEEEVYKKRKKLKRLCNDKRKEEE